MTLPIAQFGRVLVAMDGTDAMGEVQDTPTNNTLLGRLSDLLADGKVTITHTDPAIASATTLALTANADREYALFINDSDEDIYINIGAAAVMNKGIRLNSGGGSYEMSRKIGNLDVRVVNGICASGSKELLVSEGV